MLWRNFCVLSLLIILLVGLIFIFVVRNSYNSYTQNKLRNIGSDMVRNLDDGIYTDTAASDYLKSASFDNGVNIAVISPAGQIILPVDISVAEETYWSGMDTVVQEKISDSQSEVMFSYNNSYFFVAKTTYGAESGSFNFLVVSYSLDITRNAFDSLIRYVIIVSLFIILLTFIISYAMAQKISNPLQNLTKTANKMAKGDYNVKFASTEYQEIAQLSDTLNYAKDEIKKTDEFQKELLANVSHDLKTPLTMIKAYASMIQEISGDNPEKRQQHLQVIIDEADRLTGLVNDILDVSKIRSDVNQINKKVFNLTEFLFGILRKFEYLQDTKGYSFYTDIDPDMYTCADEEKIGQVLYNLISNAVNYTGEDKSVYVSLKLDIASGRIKFRVRDTGKGIKKEEIPSIWDRYYRAKEQHERPVKGTGLGLSIVKTILQKHSFDFGVESEVGVGSTFWVDFPEISSELPEEENVK